jgi:hypothetical protein
MTAKTFSGEDPALCTSFVELETFKNNTIQSALHTSVSCE